MRAAPESTARGPLAHVAAGLLVGVAYALLNAQTDVWATTDWAHEDATARAFLAFHAFVDRGIPLLAGAATGLGIHWLALRARLARAERRQTDDLRARLEHVERDQAVWVVAAATLHDVKNPLHTLGLLVEELDELAKAGHTELLAAQAARVRAALDRTVVPLDALRALAQRSRAERRLSGAASIARSVAAGFAPLAAALRVEVSLDLAARADAPVDAEVTRTVLDNVLANALEGAGGRRPRAVSIRLDADDEHVVVRVADDGPGIDAERRASLFEPLHSEKEHGLGLGLPVSRALARSVKGDLALVEDGTSPGTCFELRVPIVKEPIA